MRPLLKATVVLIVVIAADLGLVLLGWREPNPVFVPLTVALYALIRTLDR